MTKRLHRERFKILLNPIKHTKKSYYTWIVTKIFGAFQRIFLIQVIAIIIAAVEAKNIDRLYDYVRMRVAMSVLILLNARIANVAHDASFLNIRSYITQYYAKRFLFLDNTAVEGYGTGKTNSIFLSGVRSRTSIIVESFVSSFVEILAIIYAFTLIAIQLHNWKYFLVFLGAFAGVVGCVGWAFVIIHTYRKKAKMVATEQDRRLIKFLMSKFEILQNNRLANEQQETHALHMKEKNIRIKAVHKKALIQNMGMLIFTGVRVGVFVVVGVGVIHGNYELAYFVLLIELTNIMNRYIRNIRNYMKTYMKSIVHVEKMWEFFETIPSRDYETGSDFIHQKGDIELCSVGFSYQDSSIFDNLSLHIQGGKKTALVGPSGGGKTTLVKLLSGYIFPDSGEVKIDGQSLNEVNLVSYYKHMGYLTQEPNVFDGTIRSNLLYGIQYEYDENDEEFEKNLQKIISDSRCEFVYDFADGLDTEIGERGVRLSGGQRQRLAIAKIMLKNPDIIFLDEPTSALDSVSEQKVSEALHNLFEGKTVIVVAHRLQTVKEADEIIVIQDKAVAERGTHEELEAQGGVYKQMLDLQTSF